MINSVLCEENKIMEEITPQLINVNPRTLQFNPDNPNKHIGEPFEELIESIREHGMIQIPVVRELPGGINELVDGEGRTRASIILEKKYIWVISFGMVSAEKAFQMLHEANVVRAYNLIAECRGIAKLHQNGTKTAELEKRFAREGRTKRNVQDMLAVGYFPSALLDRIERDMLTETTHKYMWSLTVFHELLPLRQKSKETESIRRRNADTPEPYDYGEIINVVDKIIDGRITDTQSVKDFVLRRRDEIFRASFQRQLQKAIAQGIAEKEELFKEEGRKEVIGASEATLRKERMQLEQIKRQYDDLQQLHDKTVKELAKNPERVEELENRMREKLQEVDAEKTKYRALQQQVEREVQKTLETLRRENDLKLKEDQLKMKEESRLQLEETKKRLEAYTEEQTRKTQYDATVSVQQYVARCTELLSQSKQSFYHLMTPQFLSSLEWLSQAELVGISAELVSTIRVLSDAQQRIQTIAKNGYTNQQIEREQVR